jgi:hypothetical protein
MTTPKDIEQEIGAMSSIASALQGLDEDAISRVLGWAINKFAVRLDVSHDLRMTNKSTTSSGTGEQRQFGDVADLFASAAPKTDKEKALVVAYWFQVANGANSFESFDINRELKQLGYGLSNVTAAFTDLIEAKPGLVIQVQKSGKSQQARKKYRLTNEGIKRVDDMLRRANEEGT